MSWQLGEVPEDWKKANITPVFKKDKEERLSKLQTGQPPFCLWEDDGENPPGKHFQTHE